MDISKDIHTLGELHSDASKLILELQNNGRPMVITSDGKPCVVMIPAQMMTDKLKALHAACELVDV